MLKHTKDIYNHLKHTQSVIAENNLLPQNEKADLETHIQKYHDYDDWIVKHPLIYSNVIQKNSIKEIPIQPHINQYAGHHHFLQKKTNQYKEKIESLTSFFFSEKQNDTLTRLLDDLDKAHQQIVLEHEAVLRILKQSLLLKHLKDLDASDKQFLLKHNQIILKIENVLFEIENILSACEGIHSDYFKTIEEVNEITSASLSKIHDSLVKVTEEYTERKNTYNEFFSKEQRDALKDSIYKINQNDTTYQKNQLIIDNEKTRGHERETRLEENKKLLKKIIYHHVLIKRIFHVHAKQQKLSLEKKINYLINKATKNPAYEWHNENKEKISWNESAMQWINVASQKPVAEFTPETPQMSFCSLSETLKNAKQKVSLQNHQFRNQIIEKCTDNLHLGQTKQDQSLHKIFKDQVSCQNEEDAWKLVHDEAKNRLTNYQGFFNFISADRKALTNILLDTLDNINKQNLRNSEKLARFLNALNLTSKSIVMYDVEADQNRLFFFRNTNGSRLKNIVHDLKRYTLSFGPQLSLQKDNTDDYSSINYSLKQFVEVLKMVKTEADQIKVGDFSKITQAIDQTITSNQIALDLEDELKNYLQTFTPQSGKQQAFKYFLEDILKQFDTLYASTSFLPAQTRN